MLLLEDWIWGLMLVCVRARVLACVRACVCVNVRNKIGILSRLHIKTVLLTSVIVVKKKTRHGIRFHLALFYSWSPYSADTLLAQNKPSHWHYVKTVSLSDLPEHFVIVRGFTSVTAFSDSEKFYNHPKNFMDSRNESNFSLLHPLLDCCKVGTFRTTAFCWPFCWRSAGLRGNLTSLEAGN